MSYKSNPAAGDLAFSRDTPWDFQEFSNSKNTIIVHNFFLKDSEIQSEKEGKWFLLTLNGLTNTRPKSYIKLFEE